MKEMYESSSTELGDQPLSGRVSPHTSTDILFRRVRKERNVNSRIEFNNIIYDKLLSSPYKLEFMISMLFHHLWFNSSYENEIQIIFRDINLQISPFIRYRNQMDYGFTLGNFSFEFLLSKIKPCYIIQIFAALVLERKVLLINNNYGENAVIIESLIALLCPL